MSGPAGQSCAAVLLVQQRSVRLCAKGTTFGCRDNTTMYVSGGCRGSFRCGAAPTVCGFRGQQASERVECTCGQQAPCGAGKTKYSACGDVLFGWYPSPVSRHGSCKPSVGHRLPKTSGQRVLPPGPRRGEWELRNACVAYDESAYHLLLAHAVPGTQLVTRPVRVSEQWLEIGERGLWHSVDQSPSPAVQRARIRSRKLIWHDRAAGYLAPLSMDNLWHALWHVVPSAEHFERFLQAVPGVDPSHVDLIPHFTYYWPLHFPPGAERLQEPRLRDGHQRSAPGPGNNFRPVLRPLSTWASWRLLLLALLPKDAHDDSARRSQALVAPPGAFHCYRLLIGGHAGFWPSLRNDTAEQSARSCTRFARVRRSILLNAGLTSVAAAQVGSAQVIFMRRVSSTRVIENEAELMHAVRSSDRLAAAVRFVVPEDLTLLEQLRLVVGASAIVGVHGQNLVWAAMLSEHTSTGGARLRCALLELLPSQMTRVRTTSLLDYFKLAHLAGCTYAAMQQDDTEACHSSYFRTCGNMTVSVAAVRGAIENVLAHVLHGEPVQGQHPAVSRRSQGRLDRSGGERGWSPSDGEYSGA